VRVQRAGAGVIADMDPGGPHVVEVQRARPRVFQVADELRQDPCLIGIGDRLIRLLHQRFGPDLAPRQVKQPGRLRLGPGQRNRMHPRGGHHLMGDGQQRIELVLAGHIQVGLDLARDQLMAAGLDLDQRGPGPLPGHHLKQAIGPQLLFPVAERDLDVRR
jgi:hypothetical protein